MDHQQLDILIPAVRLQNVHQEAGTILPAQFDFQDTQPDGTIAILYKDISQEHLRSIELKMGFQRLLQRSHQVVHLQVGWDVHQIPDLQFEHREAVIERKIWRMMYFQLLGIAEPTTINQVKLFHEIRT